MPKQTDDFDHKPGCKTDGACSWDCPNGQQTGDSPPLARPSTAFERPSGNVYTVPDDGGSPLDDVSERPAIIAHVEFTEDQRDSSTQPASTTPQEQPDA